MQLSPFFLLLHFSILLLRSIAPFCFIYLALLFLSHFKWLPDHLDLYLLWGETKPFFLFNLWCCAEAGFYLFYAHTLQRFQTRRPPNHNLNPITRKRLVEQCFEALSLAHNDIQKVFESWFQGAPFKSILRGNFESWLSWAFFDKDTSELDRDEREELGKIRLISEKYLKHTFVEGFNPDARCMRLTIDPVYAFHRPLLSYGWVSIFHCLCKLVLLYLGFRKKKFPNSAHTFWYRPAATTITAYGNNKRKMSHPENGGVPVVFVHGIGVGFIPYLGLVYHFPRSVPCYLIEWRHVAMKLTERVPSIHETVTGIAGMLEADGHRNACFIAHSLGTTAVSWMIRERPDLVASTILLDPITILLCEPTVCNNFVYREPTTPVELLSKYFVSRELYISHVISRHFSWCRNILFTYQLPKDGATIFLGGSDSIVPSHAVARYLEKTVPKNSNIRVHFYENKEHGEVMLQPELLKVVVEALHKHIRRPFSYDSKLKPESDRVFHRDELERGGRKLSL